MGSENTCNADKSEFGPVGGIPRIRNIVSGNENAAYPYRVLKRTYVDADVQVKMCTARFYRSTVYTYTFIPFHDLVEI